MVDLEALAGLDDCYPRRYVVYGDGMSGDYDTYDEAVAVMRANQEAGDNSVRVYVKMNGEGNG